MSYVAGFLTFMSIGGFPSFVEDMKVIFLSQPYLLLKVIKHVGTDCWYFLYQGWVSQLFLFFTDMLPDLKSLELVHPLLELALQISPLEQHATTHWLLWVARFTIELECQVWKVNTQSCWRRIWTSYMACAGVLSWEAKWALWSGSICDRQHIFITAVPFPDIIDIRVNMLLYGRSASGVGPFCLFCSHAVCMCGVRGEPDDGCC